MEFKARGLEAMTTRIREMADRAKNPEPVTSEIGRRMKAFAQERLETRTTPDGSPFAPLTESTYRRYQYPRAQSKRGDRPLLTTIYGSGRLNKATYGSSSPYAGFLQRGTKHSPARPIFLTAKDRSGPAADEREEIKRLLAEYIKGDR